MATQNGIGFLGRVPIDTVLVGLLDAVSKGELPAAAISAPQGDAAAPSSSGSNGDHREAINSQAKLDSSAAGSPSIPPSFPLLDRYMETTSAKVWREIATKVVDGIESRKADITTRLASTSI